MTEIKTLDKYRSTEELRPNLCGTFFEVKQDKITVTSTDANKLRTADFKAITEIETSFILGKKSCDILSSLKGSFVDIETANQLNSDGEIMIKNKYSRFTVDNTVLTCYNTDEIYPKYTDVIPQDNPIECKFSNKDLIKKVDTALIFSNRCTNQVVLNINGSLKIHSEDLDLNKEYNGNIPCNHSGKNIEIAFNGSHLIEVLKNQPEQPTMLFSTPNRAMIIKDGNALVLLMPMMLNN